jgi:hypothetical protein
MRQGGFVKTDFRWKNNAMGLTNENFTTFFYEMQVNFQIEY